MSKKSKASSSQAAALVGTGFVGFGSFDPNLYTAIPPEVQVIFKKLSKKDSVTVLKAIDELKVIFEKLEEKDYEPILNRWAREFETLVEVNDWKVREAALKLHKALVTKVGRALAPHLKAFIPSWLLAHFDPENEVRMLAKASFLVALPEKKHAEALNFCKTEILEFIKEKINQTPQTLSAEAKPTDASNEKYERIVSSAVMTLGHLISSLTPEQNSKVTAYDELLDEKIWKLLTAKQNRIRSGAYAVFKALCTNYPGSAKKTNQESVLVLMYFLIAFIEKNLQKLTPIVLGLLGEKESSTHVQMWDLMLNYMKLFPQSWDHIDYNQVVFSKLWALLSAGAYGSVEQTYPFMLPFLSLLPKTTKIYASDKALKEFLDNFFNNMWKGFVKSENIKKNNETVALGAYMECLVFAVVRAGEFGAQLQSHLISTHFLPILTGYLKYEKVLFESLPKAMTDFVLGLKSKLNGNEEPIKEIWISLDGKAKFHLHLKGEEALSTDFGAQKIFAEHLGSFLVKFPATFPQEDATFGQLLQKIFNSFSEICKVQSVHEMSLLSKLANTFGVDKLSLKSPAVFYAEDLLGSLKLNLDELSNIDRSAPHYNEKSQFVLNALDISSSIFLQFIFSEEDRRAQWTTLLSLLSSFTDLSFVHYVLQKVCGHSDKLDWSSPALNTLALDVAKNTYRFSADPMSVELLNLLMTGNGHSLVSNDVLSDVIRFLNKELQDYISKNQREPELNNNNKLLSSVLDVIQHFIDASTLSSFNELKIESLALIFEGCLLTPSYVSEEDRLAKVPSTVQEHVFNKKCKGIWTQAHKAIESLVHTNSVKTKLIEPICRKIKLLIVESDINIRDLVVAVNQLVKSLNHEHGHHILENVIFTESNILGMHSDVMHDLDLDILAWNVSAGELDKKTAQNNNAVNQYRRIITFITGLISLLGSDLMLAKWPTLVYELLIATVLSKGEVKAHTGKLHDHEFDSIEWIAFAKQLQTFVDTTLLPFMNGHVDLMNSLVAVAYARCAQYGSMNGQALFNLLNIIKTQVNADSIVHEQLIPKLDKASLSSVEASVPLFDKISSESAGKLLQFVFDMPLNNIATIASHVSYVLAVKSLLNKSHKEALFKTKSALEKYCIAEPKNNHVALSAIKLFDHVIIPLFRDDLVENDWRFITNHTLMQLTRAKLSVAQDWPLILASVNFIFNLYMNFPNKTEALWTNFSFKSMEVLFTDLCASLKHENYNVGLNTLLKQLTTVMRLAIHNDVFMNANKAPLYKLLSYPHVGVQATSYLLLERAIKYAPKQEEAKPVPHTHSGDDFSDNIDVRGILPDELNQIIQDSDFYHDQSEAEVDHVQEFHMRLGMMLSWAVFFVLFKSKSAKEKSDLGTYLRRQGVAHEYLKFLFANIDAKIGLPENHELLTLLIQDFGEDYHSYLAKVGSFLFKQTLSSLPALVRAWWTDLSDRNLVALVDKYSSTYITPELLKSEYDLIGEFSAKASGDYFGVKSSRMTNEVTATYEKDEVKLSIVLKIPANYPIRSVTVEMVRRIGIQDALWRKWLLSMTTLLLTQDGTILDAVLLWKQYLDQHFEGVECCPICYSIFHVSNYSLPSMKCKTCRNKFHPACMFKWFNTSHKNECPLCKTPFN